MIELLKELCSIDGTSGDEGAVRDFIISKLDGFCDLKTDALGNIIAFKKGAKRPAKKAGLFMHFTGRNPYRSNPYWSYPRRFRLHPWFR